MGGAQLNNFQLCEVRARFVDKTARPHLPLLDYLNVLLSLIVIILFLKIYEIIFQSVISYIVNLTSLTVIYLR